ncbi:hypothetical protein ACFQZR_00940 [Paenibacillus sp. GCM10027629]|uniref:hypothetical protein n=1 Tax=Paenibacillus sp. GCM10027629 TaxID=3273414 RepID=UPI00362B6F50
MTPYHFRQREIVTRITNLASQQPVLSSGLWFHHDIRDNFYYASYLFAAAVDSTIPVSFDRDEMKALATSILLQVLQLQDQDPSSPTYGHWPLNLDPVPSEAKPHPLPVEIMGSLMVYFDSQYQVAFSDLLRTAFATAFLHIYQGNFYRKPMEQYGHHEAKFTSAKLIFGHKFQDIALIQDGHDSLKLTLDRIHTLGMWEYGSLPWFWHWVQAYTCAYTLEQNDSIRQDISHLLDALWRQRSQYYLKGTWVGAHARGGWHDVPRDGNVLLDYVQYGDFILSEAMPRTEYAGFLFYEAPADARQTALDRSKPLEVRQRITRLESTGPIHLHSYAYITEHYAAGGMWERYTEFDNEQQRWDITIPLVNEHSINQAYFFHPGDGYHARDPRHHSEYAHTLYHRNTVMALYSIPETSPVDYIVGVLPKGTWQAEPSALYGLIENVYIAVHLMQPYQYEEMEDRLSVRSEGRWNGVVIEAIAVEEAMQLGMESFELFIEAMQANAPVFAAEADGVLQVQYHTRYNEELQLTVHGPNHHEARIGGEQVDFEGYKV